MKRIIFIAIFVLGLGIFLYPMVSNMLATTAHQSTIKEYHQTVKELDASTIEKEKEKVAAHNEELAQSDMNFVDPFADEKTDEEQGTKSYYDALNIGPAIGSVEIPKINVALPIYHGTSDDVLSRGAGHLENSSLPSNKLGTHSVITAHRGLPSSKLFRNLDEVQIGDHFYVEVLDETLAYEVDSIEVVLPSETEWLTMEEDANKMTLLTCDPYMINTHRMLVTGHQIPYVPGQEDSERTKSYTLYYVVGGLFALLFILFILRKRLKNQGEAS